MLKMLQDLIDSKRTSDSKYAPVFVALNVIDYTTASCRENFVYKFISGDLLQVDPTGITVEYEDGKRHIPYTSIQYIAEEN